jgi:hypothetical protein
MYRVLPCPSTTILPRAESARARVVAAAADGAAADGAAEGAAADGAAADGDAPLLEQAASTALSATPSARERMDLDI